MENAFHIDSKKHDRANEKPAAGNPCGGPDLYRHCRPFSPETATANGRAQALAFSQKRRDDLHEALDDVLRQVEFRLFGRHLAAVAKRA